jgi:putative spermidine/putrescine transport system permease protein
MATGQRRRATLLLIAPAALVLLVFLVIPYINIVLMSFRPPGDGAPYGAGFTLANYRKFFSDSFYILQVVNTLWIGFVVTLSCLLIGFPVAWQLARGESRLRPLYYSIVLAPLLVGIVIRSYGWTVLLGNNGVINRTLMGWGVTDGPLPLMYNGLGIDPSLEAAARSLGASRAVAFRRVLLPLARPGIQTGSILVFVLAISAYVTPALIGGLRVKTMAVTIVDALIDTFQWPFGSALALVLSVVGALCVIVFARLTRMRWKVA